MLGVQVHCISSVAAVASSTAAVLLVVDLGLLEDYTHEELHLLHHLRLSKVGLCLCGPADRQVQGQLLLICAG